MSTTIADSGRGWRWTLIAAEVLVAAHLGAALAAGRKTRLDLGAAEAVVFFVAFLFLLFGAPFLVRRHGWLAIAGWAIGAAALLSSGL
jgi:hypothetical protein